MSPRKENCELAMFGTEQMPPTQTPRVVFV
jgi:hypothetical protein